METINELKQHLKNCGEIMNKFIKEHKLQLHNINVQHETWRYLNSSVSMKFYDGSGGYYWERYTVKQAHNHLRNLNQQFKDYLNENNIDYHLYIKSLTDSDGYTCKIKFEFKIEIDY